LLTTRSRTRRRDGSAMADHSCGTQHQLLGLFEEG
jgi:hypothetical protein